MENHSLWPPEMLNNGSNMLPGRVPPKTWSTVCGQPMTVMNDKTLTDKMETLLLVSKSIKHPEVSTSVSEGILKNCKTEFI